MRRDSAIRRGLFTGILSLSCLPLSTARAQERSSEASPTSSGQSTLGETDRTARPDNLEEIERGTVRIVSRFEKNSGLSTMGPYQSQNPPKKEVVASGFVARVENGEVLVATASPVLEMPEQQRWLGSSWVHKVVFDPGTPEEREVAAQVVASDPLLGLALLRTEKMESPPKALPVFHLAVSERGAAPVRPTFFFGAYTDTRTDDPFFRTVTPTSLPEHEFGLIKQDFRELPIPQFAGGPIVDLQGRVVGVGVPVASGAVPYFWVPVNLLSNLFKPNFSTLSFRASGEEGSSSVKGRIPTQLVCEVQLSDPMRFVKKAWVLIVPTRKVSGIPKASRTGEWRSIGTRAGLSNELVINNSRKLSATIDLRPEYRSSSTVYWVQVCYTRTLRSYEFGEPIRYHFRNGEFVPEAATEPTTTLASTPSISPPPGIPRFNLPGRGANPSRPEPGTSTRASAMPTRIQMSPSAPEEPKRIAVSPEDEPKGGFGALAGSSGDSSTNSTAGANLVPESIGRTIAGTSRPVDDAKVTELQVTKGEVLPCMLWSQDKTHFYLAEKTGIIRRIKAEGLVEEVRLDTKSPCAWLALSAEGLVLTLTTTQEIWILDPVTLRFKGRVESPGLVRAVASPLSSMAFAQGGSGYENASMLMVIDLKKKVIVHQYESRDFDSRVHAKFKNLAITPDGKFLFSEGGIEQLQRFRAYPDRVDYQDSSGRIAANGRTIVISPDGYYVALPAGGGNDPTKPYTTFIYKITNLKTPAIAIHGGAYPQAIGFDMKAGLVYAQNHSTQLMVFLPSGLKQSEYQFGQTGSVIQLLAHPAGRKVFVLGESQLLFVELP